MLLRRKADEVTPCRVCRKFIKGTWLPLSSPRHASIF
jgi:hypothetical protein